MTRNAQYYLLDVFTDQTFAGNQLAVFPSSEGLNSETMQAIANELNLAETVFIGQAEATNRYPIRIFTPTKELPFAGHPTVGTAHLLAELKLAERSSPLTLEANVGPLVVTFENDLARFRTAQPVEISASTLNREKAARLLGLEESEVMADPVLSSCGLPFHLIELGSLAALKYATPSPQGWAKWVAPSGYEQIYLYVIDKSADQVTPVRSRMFSTKGGIREDPATGSAAAALAGALAATRQDAGPWRWHIQQGIEMGRPSHIHAQAQQDGDTMVIHIAGQAVIVGSGKIRIGA